MGNSEVAAIVTTGNVGTGNVGERVGNSVVAVTATGGRVGASVGEIKFRT